MYGRANEKRHAHALIAIGPCDEQKIETLISKFQLQEDGLHEVKLRWNQNPEEQLEEKLSEVWPYMPDIIDFARVTIIKRIEASNTIGIITNEYIDNMTVDVVSSMCKKYIQDYLTGKRHE